jgi:hypothetical protein
LEIAESLSVNFFGLRALTWQREGMENSVNRLKRSDTHFKLAPNAPAQVREEQDTTMSDSKKTKQELLAELEALRAELDALKTVPDKDVTEPAHDGITRREAIAGWVAPVVLSIPLAGHLSSAEAEPRASIFPKRAPVPSLIFEDGFETGDTSRWSASVGEVGKSEEE